MSVPNKMSVPEKIKESGFDIHSPKTANRFMALFMLYLVFTQFLVTIVAMAVVPDFENINMVMFQLFYMIIGFCPPIILYYQLSGKKFTDIVPLKRVDSPLFFLSFLIGITIQPLTMTCSAITSLFYENNVPDFMGGMLGGTNFYMVIFVIAVVPAFVEEFVFRGIILSGYKKHSPLVAGVINGIFFAIMHMNLAQFLYAFVLGIVFAYMTKAAKSVIPAMIAHFTMNASQLSLYYFTQEALKEPELAEAAELAAAETSAFSTLTAIGIVFLITSPALIFTLYNFFKRCKKTDAQEALATQEALAAQELKEVSTKETAAETTQDLTQNITQYSKQEPPQPPTKAFTISFFVVLLMYPAIIYLLNFAV